MLVALRATSRRSQPRSSCPKETLEELNSIPPTPSNIENKNEPKVLVHSTPRTWPLGLKFPTYRRIRLAKSIVIDPNQPIEQNDPTPHSPQIVLESPRGLLPESVPVELDSYLGDTIQEAQSPPKTEEEFNDIGVGLLRKVGPDCYVALDIDVEANLKRDFEQKYKLRLKSFLESLQLRDCAVLLECVLACSTPHRDQVQPTILVLCLNEEHKRAINGGLRKMTLIPNQYQCMVVVQEVELSSSATSIPSNPGIMSGQVVLARFLENKTLCGVIGRAIGGDSDCTLGGLIRVGGSIYALTTAHGFVRRGGRVLSTIIPTGFEPVGNIYSYNFTETSSRLEADDGTSLNTSSGQDWALVRVQPLLYRVNSYEDPKTGSIILIEGHVRTPDLCHGAITVLSSLSGIRQGYMSAGSSTLLIGESCFEVRTIALDGPLKLGDSGSWVVRDGKLCGYILARMVGRPWAYMLPIGPIFQEITKAFSFDGAVSVEVPSKSKLDNLRDTTISLKSQIPIATRLKLSPPLQNNSSGNVLPTDESKRVGNEKFERIIQEVQAKLPVLSSKGRHLQRPNSINGQHLQLFGNEILGSNQSPAQGVFPLQKTKLHEYNEIWRRNHTLSFDSGGTRGYSQLIILKALMDKVTQIERSRPDEDGNLVRSSFHPYLPEDNKSVLRPKENRRRQKKIKNRASTNIPKNSSNGKGKKVESLSGLALSTEVQEEEIGKFYPYHYFDYIAGTGIGGLNAIMLGRLRMSIDECISSYIEITSKVFGRPRFASYRCSPLFWFCTKYSSNRLKDIVKDIVDKHLCEGEDDIFAMNKEMCRTVVLAMKKNTNNHEMEHLFRTYNHYRQRLPVNIRLDGLNSRPNLRNPIKQTSLADSSLIWEVARATSAAPTYFNTIKIGENEYGNTGFGENNPSTRLFWEVCQMNNENVSANELSISIGTGISRFTRFQTGLLTRPIGWINAAKKVSTDCEIVHMDMERFSKSLTNHKYVRFNVPEKATEDIEPSKWQYLKKQAQKWFDYSGEPLDRGLGKIKLDEWKSRGWWRKESTQEEIERITMEYLNDPEVNIQLKEVAGMMVSHRRARARTDRWETYALGIRYKCPLTFEQCPDNTWTDKRGLRRHLIEDHEYDKLEATLEHSLEQALSYGKYYEDHN